jgi:hypothetical protein
MGNQLQSEQLSHDVDHVGRIGVDPVLSPRPAGNAPLVGQGQLRQPEQRQSVAAVLSRLTSPGVSLWFGRAIFGGTSSFTYGRSAVSQCVKESRCLRNSKESASPRC